MGERYVSDEEVTRCYWEAVRERLVTNSRSSFRDFAAGYRSVTAALVTRARRRALRAVVPDDDEDGREWWP